MAPRKSSRIQNKYFKSKPSKTPVEISEDSGSQNSMQSSGGDRVEATPKTTEKRTKDSHDPSKGSEKDPSLAKEAEKEVSEEQDGKSSSEELASESTKEKEVDSKSDSDDESETKSDSKSESAKDASSESTTSSPPPQKRKSVSNPKKASKRVKKQKVKTLKPIRSVKSKIHSCSFIDFRFFEKNGFYIGVWLDRIGARSLCDLHIDIVGEFIDEFYKNLKFENETLLISKVGGKKIVVNRKILIDCLGLLDHGDDHELITLGRNESMQLLNDGIGKFHAKDIFITEFELLIRLLHKIVIECILPKKGSPTSISKEEAIIILGMKLQKQLDLPRIILRHMWRNKKHMIYGNIIMKILQKHHVKMPKHVSNPQLMRKIGDKVIKHMSISVKEKFWYSIDGAFYVHPKNRKREFTLKRILDEIEKEDPHGDEKSKKRKADKDDKGKGKAPIAAKKRKRDYELGTGKKFEIKEGQTVESDSDSETESEGIPMKPPGETSQPISLQQIDNLISSRMEAFLKKFDLTSFQKSSPTDHSSPPMQSNPPEQIPVSTSPPAANIPKDPTSPPATEVPPADDPDSTVHQQDVEPPAEEVPVSAERESVAAEDVPVEATPEQQAAASLLSIPHLSPAEQPSEAPSSPSPAKFSGRKKSLAKKKGSKKK